MLSIGKVGGTDADPRYYIESVAQGREDYYSGQGESPGTWTGLGAATRGLAGTVDEDDFITVLADGHPSRKVLGFDLTFSAPKSVSILFGVSDPETSRAVVAAHDAAVEQAVGYVERHATWTRRGHAGRVQLQGDGLTVAQFRHRSSRAGDPQLHTHAVIANATDADGSSSALDSRALYAHARTAGFLYQSVLRAELTRHVGVEWTPVENGVAEVAGVDADIRREFSRRREEILEHMRARGGRSAKSAQVAALETRRVKEYDVAASRLHDEWRARAAEHGFGQDELREVLDRRAPGRPPTIDLAEAAERIAAPGGVTRQASTFDRRDVLRDWAEAHRDGADVVDLEALADRWLRSTHAVRLERGECRRHLGGARYSTPDMLDTEARLIETGRTRRHSDVAVAEREAVSDVLAADRLLTPEQRALVEHVTGSGNGIDVVRAAAGTGKTRALANARDAWERSGVQVYGCALAARAAVEMETLAGIDSTTIARFEYDLQHGYGLPRGSVLVVDEAGMVGSRALERLARHAAETDSKLLLVGDDHQLPEIDAGGGYRGLADTLGAIEMKAVQRQAEGWDREALHALRNGRLGRWAESYRDHGRLVARPTAAACRTAVVDDWWESARAGEDAVMIAHRRSDVAELNKLARARMHRDGRLDEEELVAGQRAYAVGDRVIARRNDRTLGIVNGHRGAVTAVDVERRTVTVDLGEDHAVVLDGSYLDEGSLDHGYALTAHAAQGATVERAYVLGSDDLYREWGYTALSRHRTEARYYVVSPGSVERALPGLEPDEDEFMDDVLQTLQRRRRKHMAVDVLQRESGVGWRPRPEPTVDYDDVANRAADDTRQLVMNAAGASEPSPGVRRPMGLAGRDDWARVAARTVSLPTHARPDAALSATLSDTGLEL